MKTPTTFLTAFLASFLLLAVHSWSRNVLPIASVLFLAILLFGGFAWMFFQVVADLVSRTKSKSAGAIALGIVLLILGLTWSFDVFPYLWNALAAILLVCCLAWQCFQDYFEFFWRRKAPHATLDWTAVAQSQLPATEAKTRERVKDRLRHSYDLHGACIPRMGPLGASSHPLDIQE